MNKQTQIIMYVDNILQLTNKQQVKIKQKNKQQTSKQAINQPD